MSAVEHAAEQAIYELDFGPMMSFDDASNLRASFRRPEGQFLFFQAAALRGRAGLTDFLSSLREGEDATGVHEFYSGIRGDVERLDLLARMARSVEIRTLIVAHDALGEKWSDTDPEPTEWDLALRKVEVELEREAGGSDDDIVPALNRLITTEVPNLKALATKLDMAFAYGGELPEEFTRAIIADVHRLAAEHTAERYYRAPQTDAEVSA